MAAQRARWLAGLASVFLGPVALAAQADVAREGKAAEPERPPVLLGLLADAGVPDGATAALVLLPARWLRFHAGGGYNTVSGGYRGGLALLPFGAGPSLNLEAGHYRDGDANGFVRTFAGTSRLLRPILQRVGYTYVNTQLGLDMGHGAVQFYVHGGVSYVRATLHNAQAALDSVEAESGNSDTTIHIVQDPIVHAWVPSLKLGVVVYLGGGAR
jgi:hypothetical protein